MYRIPFHVDAASLTIEFMRKILSKIISGPLVLVGLQSCSTQAIPYGSTEPEVKEKVRVQVCLPGKRIYFNEIELDQVENYSLFTSYSPEQLAIAPKTVRRVAAADDPRVINNRRVIQNYGISFGEVLLRSGQRSDGFGYMPLKDATVADQPIYEKGYGYAPKEYVAMHVRLPDKDRGEEGDVTYWFKLPKVIPAKEFSNWFKPISTEPAEEKRGKSNPIWWKLTHGADLPIYPVSDEAPRMRVTLLWTDNQHKDASRDSLPALSTARTKYKTATSDQQFVYEFVAKSNEAVPKCD
jgi:hypothetical protein